MRQTLYNWGYATLILVTLGSTMWMAYDWGYSAARNDQIMEINRQQDSMDEAIAEAAKLQARFNKIEQEIE